MMDRNSNVLGIVMPLLIPEIACSKPRVLVQSGSVSTQLIRSWAAPPRKLQPQEGCQ